MALTESTMLKLGSVAPDFELPDTAGQMVSKNQFAGQPLLVMFICNHCPHVKHVASELARLGSDYAEKEIGLVAIQSNDADQYPDDSPEMMRKESDDRGYRFPYLYDETQRVALAYTAAGTPDFFLFDSNHQLVYRGRLDETRPTRIRSGVYDSVGHEAHGRELRAAMNATLAGGKPDPNQFPAMGCNIKWKPGNEPSCY